LPLLRMLERLASDRSLAPITLSLSPTLLAMLEDPLLQQRYDDHLARLLILAERELERTADDPRFHRLAEAYHRMFLQARADFARHDGRLSRPFLELHRQGALELCTTTATHGILPLLQVQPRAVEAQVRVGLDYFEAVFGFRPGGMWLPECAYTPALDDVLARHGVKHFVIESHGLGRSGDPICHPVRTRSGVACFGRDQASTLEVWSAQHGFPGDPDYREFYRDIGFDLDPGYLRDALGDDVRAMTGIKYYRITGPSPAKEPYDPDRARAKAEQHAAAFLAQRIEHLAALDARGASTPVLVAPFDAELFGHWWFEGPSWLELVLRQAAAEQEVFRLTTLGGYLDRYPDHPTRQPATSTWGRAGYFDMWLSRRNDWIFEHLIGCGQRLERLILEQGSGPVTPLARRALNQCLRELLLAQSSDWPFIVSTGTAAGYAERRIRDHVGRFCWLANALEAGRIDEEQLAAIEWLDNLFPELDYGSFAVPAAAA
jgi:1,4-alpha-glucan branching enzyme